MKPNMIIRSALFLSGMKKWQLAVLLGMSEPTLYRKLRAELPEPEQREIAARIEEFTAQHKND